MNEYKKFFKQAEHNHRVNGVRVGIQNPLEKTLAENKLERKLHNEVEQHFRNQSKNNSRSKSQSREQNRDQVRENLIRLHQAENERTQFLSMKGMRVADIEKSLGKGNLRLVRRNETAKKKKSSSIPFKTLSILGVGFALCLWSLIEPEGLSHVMKSVEISAFGSAHADSQSKPLSDHAKTKDVSHAADSSAPLSQKHDVSSQTPPQAKPISAQQVRQWTDEELNFFNDLNKRKEDLEKREKDLALLETELQKRQGEIEQKIKALEKTRGQIANVLQDRVKTDEERVDKLVQFYSSMKPTNAARIISTLDEGLAITILNKMKKQDAASILNFIEPQRAKEISEKFAGYTKN